MSDNIVDFLKKRRQAPNTTVSGPDEPFVFVCPKCQKDNCFAPLCTLSIKSQPIIQGLICESDICAGDTVWDVQHGRLIQIRMEKVEVKK